MARRLRTAVLAALLAAAGSARCAELVVIDSSAPGLEPGTVIDGAKAISLAAGVEVTLVSATGRTVRLTGPYEGAPQSAPVPDETGIVGALARLVERREEKGRVLAAFRSALRPPPPGRPDIWGIDISRGGRYCLRPDAPAMLWWPAAGGAKALTVARAGAGGEGVRLRWPRRERSMAWPAELELASGDSYVARFWQGDAGERFTVVLMPDLATDAHRAAWMADNGCADQALRVLDALADGEL